MVKLPLKDIETLCRAFAVERLWIFGSAATGRFDPARSDMDFVVEFGTPIGMTSAAQYFDFQSELEGLLRRPVDLIERSAIRNPYLQESIRNQEQLLYAA